MDIGGNEIKRGSLPIQKKISPLKIPSENKLNSSELEEIKELNNLSYKKENNIFDDNYSNSGIIMGFFGILLIVGIFIFALINIIKDVVN